MVHRSNRLKLKTAFAQEREEPQVVSARNGHEAEAVIFDDYFHPIIMLSVARWCPC